jgi:hypothetical protein
MWGLVQVKMLASLKGSRPVPATGTHVCRQPADYAVVGDAETRPSNCIKDSLGCSSA